MNKTKIEERYHPSFGYYTVTVPSEKEKSLERLFTVKDVTIVAVDAYNWAINNGIAKEQARCVLPEGNTPSRLFMNGTIRSWIHYIELRSGHGTQKEHMEIARACAEVISEVFPMIEEFVE